MPKTRPRFIDTDAPELDPFGRKKIVKHEHERTDQSGHGNWARGGATKTTGAPDYTPLEDAKKPKRKPGEGGTKGTQDKLEGLDLLRGDIGDLLGFNEQNEWDEEVDVAGQTLWEFEDNAKSDWMTWQGARDIRQAAAEIAGVDDDETFETVDPHVEMDARDHSGGFHYNTDSPHRSAQFLMESLVDGEKYRDLHRAIGMLNAAEMADFLELAQPGATFDAPLLSFANMAVMGETNILDRFGTDILLKVDGSATGYFVSQMEEPLWTKQDEGRWLRGLEIEMLSGIDDQEEPELWEHYSEVREAIGTHLGGGERLDEYQRQDLTDLVGGEDYARWAGTKISESEYPDEYYGYMDEQWGYQADVPSEIISGGRFKVKSVERGEGEYEPWTHVITVEQVGVFDPFNEDTLIMKMVKAAFVLDGGSLSVGYEKKKRPGPKIAKHYGPGPHPSGSPQDVHGGPKRLPMDRLPGEDWSQYGIEHPEIPDRAWWDDWSPVMTEEEADDMLLEHDLDQIYYGAHATVDPEAVMREGFEADEIGSGLGVGWGEGLYMVQEDADDYYETAMEYSTAGTSVRIAMGMENPLEVFAEDPSEATYEAMLHGPEFGAMFHYTGPGMWPLDHYKIITEWAEIPWDPAWDGEPWGPHAVSASDAYPGLSKVLSDAGYDGLVINAPRVYPVEFFGIYADEDIPEGGDVKYDPDWYVPDGQGQPAPGLGGSQTILFDPQHSAIIGTTEFTDGLYGSPDVPDAITTALEAVSKTWVPGVTDDMVRQVYGPWLKKKVAKHADHNQDDHGNWARRGHILPLLEARSLASGVSLSTQEGEEQILQIVREEGSPKTVFRGSRRKGLKVGDEVTWERPILSTADRRHIGAGFTRKEGDHKTLIGFKDAHALDISDVVAENSQWEREHLIEGGTWKLVEETMEPNENYPNVMYRVLWAERVKSVGKHYGPGPHASGSSQDVHGKKGPVKVGMYDTTETLDPKTPEGAFNIAKKRYDRFTEAAEAFEQEFNNVANRWTSQAPWGDYDEVYNTDIYYDLDTHYFDGAQEWMETNYPNVLDTLQYESANDFWYRSAEFKALSRKVADDGTLLKAVENLDTWMKHEAKPFIRVSPETLQKILYGGQVLNQTATGESNGWYDPVGREHVEDVLFGYGLEEWTGEGPDERGYPIYGYFADDAYVWNEGPVPTFEHFPTADSMAESLEHYGSAAIELKHGVSATYTLGDSLDDTGVQSIFQGPLSQSQAFLAPGTAGWPSVGTVGAHAAELAHGNDPQSVARFIEAQYHEKITFDDIRAIHIPQSELDDLSMTANEYHDEYLPAHIELVVHE